MHTPSQSSPRIQPTGNRWARNLAGKGETLRREPPEYLVEIRRRRGGVRCLDLFLTRTAEFYRMFDPLSVPYFGSFVCVKEASCPIRTRVAIHGRICSGAGDDEFEGG